MVRTRLLFAAAAAAAIAACGGSGSTTSTTTQASVSGTVTGLGNMAIDGVAYQGSAPTVSVDVGTDQDQAGTAADVRLGCHVEGAVDGLGRLASLVVRATVFGPVDAIDTAAGTLTVLGQTVHVTAAGGTSPATFFEGVSGLAGLKAGDWVEVHGTFDTAGSLTATRVELETAPSPVRVRVAGVVTAVDDAAKTFTIGGLVVDRSSAKVVPSGATIAVGSLVYAAAGALPSSGKLAADRVRVQQLPAVEGRPVKLRGVVHGYASLSDFQVGPLHVDGSAATLSGGTAADVKDGARVRVEGTLHVTSTSPLAVVVKATAITLVPVETELAGPITDFTSPSSFKVQGTLVDASGAKVDGGALTDLADGTFVLVEGAVSGDKVVATELRIVQPPAAHDVTVVGTVSHYDAAAGTFTLHGILVKLASATTFEGGALADLADGKLVAVTGTCDGTALAAAKVAFLAAPPSPPVVLSGVASAVTATGFQLGDQTIAIDASTVVEPKGATLKDGDRVFVCAKTVGGALVAVSIAILPDQHPQFTGATGAITAFTSQASFTVAGQVIDATGATFYGGDASKLAVGVDVQVLGALDASGVLQAEVVRILR